MAVAHPERTRRVALYDAYVYDEQVPSFFRWAQKAGLGELLFGLFYKERIEDRAPLAYYDERWITQARVDRVERDMDKPGTTAAALAAARGHHFAASIEQLATSTKPVLLLWGANDEVDAGVVRLPARERAARRGHPRLRALRTHPDGRGAQSIDARPRRVPCQGPRPWTHKRRLEAIVTEAITAVVTIAVG